MHVGVSDNYASYLEAALNLFKLTSTHSTLTQRSMCPHQQGGGRIAYKMVSTGVNVSKNMNWGCTPVKAVFYLGLSVPPKIEVSFLNFEVSLYLYNFISR